MWWWKRLVVARRPAPKCATSVCVRVRCVINIQCECMWIMERIIMCVCVITNNFVWLFAHNTLRRHGSGAVQLQLHTRRSGRRRQTHRIHQPARRRHSVGGGGVIFREPPAPICACSCERVKLHIPSHCVCVIRNQYMCIRSTPTTPSTTTTTQQCNKH